MERPIESLPEPTLDMGQRVLIARADDPCCDLSFIGHIGVITDITRDDPEDWYWTYQVTLPDGRHDGFYVEELEKVAMEVAP